MNGAKSQSQRGGILGKKKKEKNTVSGVRKTLREGEASGNPKFIGYVSSQGERSPRPLHREPALKIGLKARTQKKRVWCSKYTRIQPLGGRISTAPEEVEHPPAQPSYLDRECSGIFGARELTRVKLAGEAVARDKKNWSRGSAAIEWEEG